MRVIREARWDEKSFFMIVCLRSPISLTLVQRKSGDFRLR